MAEVGELFGEELYRMEIERLKSDRSQLLQMLAVSSDVGLMLLECINGQTDQKAQIRDKLIEIKNFATTYHSS